MTIINQLILASTSAIRAQLLRETGLAFSVSPSGFNEKTIQLPQADQLAQERARQKALTVARQNEKTLIIGCDQTLSLGDQLFSKPKNKDDAFTRLTALSGKTHYLHSAVAFAYQDNQTYICLKKISFIKTLSMHMRSLSSKEIEHYVETDEWQGCVGGYRIEGKGRHLFTKSTSTDFSAIMGLPILELLAALRTLGVDGLTKSTAPWTIPISFNHDNL